MFLALDKKEIQRDQLIMVLFNIIPSQIRTFIEGFLKLYKRTQNFVDPAIHFAISFSTPPKIFVEIKILRLRVTQWEWG